MQINLLIAVVCLNMAKIPNLAAIGGFSGQPEDCHNFSLLGASLAHNR
jgi:hypothetical protein